MKVGNKTHYFSLWSRTYNELPEPDSFAFQSSKRVGYAQRMYYELKDTERTHGSAFYYTFTYNDNAIPQWNGHSCFSYDDVRLLTNGLIQKHLLRDYGSQCRYFCACESGEGKGKRGLGNNPHYHIIFFVSPIRDNDNNPIYTNYKPITPMAFRELCRKVWQYRKVPKSVSADGYQICDYRTARFGHCQEGDNCGLVINGDAFSYVSKYVTKDDETLKVESEVFKYYYAKVMESGITTDVLMNWYQYKKSNLPTPMSEYAFKRYVYQYGGFDQYSLHRSIVGRDNLSYEQFIERFHPEIKETFCNELIEYFERVYKPQAVNAYLRDWRNKHGNKVRTSKSLGVYALNFVSSPETNPTLTLTTTSQVLTQKPCLYYYRKLYYDVYHCPFTANPIYVLNDLGRNLKHSQLPSSINSHRTNTMKSLHFFSGNKDMYYGEFDQNDIQALCNKLLHCKDIDYLLNRYSVYKLVYAYRHYDPEHDNFAIMDGYTMANVHHDYELFMLNNAYSLDYSDNKVYLLVRHSALPSFLDFFEDIKPYIPMLDSLVVEYGRLNSQWHKSAFAERANFKKSINQQKFNLKEYRIFAQ